MKLHMHYTTCQLYNSELQKDYSWQKKAPLSFCNNILLHNVYSMTRMSYLAEN